MFGASNTCLDFCDCYDRFLRESENEYDNMNAW